SVTAPGNITFSPGDSKVINNVTIQGFATTAANTPVGQKSLTLQVGVQNAFAALPTGSYTAKITSSTQLNLPITAGNSNWTSTYAYTQPTAKILGLPTVVQSSLSVPLQGVVQSGLGNQATFNVYADTHAGGYHGVPLATKIAYGSGTPTV